MENAVDVSSILEQTMTVKKEAEDEVLQRDQDGLARVWVKTEPGSEDEKHDVDVFGAENKVGSSGEDMKECPLSPTVTLQEGPSAEGPWRKRKKKKRRKRTEEEDRECKFRCGECGKGFTQRGNYNQHTTSHSRRFVCDDCGAEFAKRGQMERHMLVHTQDRRFQCPVCPAKFAYKCNLDRHLTVHTGQRKHVCEVCQKTFSQSWNLKEHQRVHYGHRRFNCSFCSKQFTRKSNLQSHELTHAGLRRFRCDLCPRQFNQACHLKQHVLTHVHGETRRKNPDKKHKCDVCQASFTLKRNLQRHVVSHSTPAPNQSRNVHFQRHLHALATTIKVEPLEVSSDEPQIKMEEPDDHTSSLDPISIGEEAS